MRRLSCLLLSAGFLLSGAVFAGDLALPKIRLVAEGGFIELVRPYVRDLAEQMPEHQPVLSANADALDSKPLFALSTGGIPGAAAIPFALKGTIVAVNKQNPLKEISSKDVMKIMRNQYPQWPGTGVPVRNIYLAAGALRARSGAGKGKTHFVEVNSVRIAAELVKKDVTAVALLPLSFAAEPDGELKLLPVDGVAPDFEPVLNGLYPLAKRYYLSVDPEAPDAVKRLAERIQAPGFRRNLLANGFIPLRKDGK